MSVLQFWASLARRFVTTSPKLPSNRHTHTKNALRRHKSGHSCPPSGPPTGKNGLPDHRDVLPHHAGGR